MGKNKIKSFQLKQISYLILFTFCVINVNAQYDNTHYIPPVYSKTSTFTNIGKHYLFLSTNETTKFLVTVRDGNGVIIGQDSISKSSPDSIYLGDQGAAIGVIYASELNTVSRTEGIIATASKPFFANIRNNAAAQGISLTAKGKIALGQRFRSGHIYTRKNLLLSPYGLHSHFISVMASEDSTVVNFGDFETGLIFHNTPVTGNTSDPISIVLNKHETYTIGANLDESLALANDTGINNTLITSNKPIVVNCGSICGGNVSSSPASSRDNGADQIVPVNLTGTEYIVSKRNNNAPEFTERVIISTDTAAATVYMNGSTTALLTIPAGGFHVLSHNHFNADGIMQISTDNKISVFQTTNGSPNGTANAHGLNFIPPISCSGAKEVTIPYVNFLGNSGIDIITKSNATVSINGGAALTGSFSVPGDPTRVIYKVNNVTGTQNIVSNEVMSVSLITNSGDRGAAGYFSGFIAESAPRIETFSEFGNDFIIEGCEDAIFVIDKDLNQINEDVTFYFNVEGSATYGIDYSAIPDSLFIPGGQLSDTIRINTIMDDISESVETIIISISSRDNCGRTIFIDDTLEIRNVDPLEISADFDSYFCPENEGSTPISISVSNGIKPYSYEWNTSEYNGSDDMISVYPTIPTVYNVRVEDACGNTINSEDMLVQVQCSISVPNVFTPNSDGINDLFFIDHYGLNAMNMTIYNRWGSKVFYSEAIDGKWDGRTISGKECSDGTYYYLLNYINVDGSIGELQGNVTLIQ